MSTSLVRRDAALVHPADLFPKAADSPGIRALHEQYGERKAEIEAIGVFVGRADYAAAVGYFLDGNTDPDSRSGARVVASNLFRVPPAIKALDADFWGRALDLTDVYQVMPQARREKWTEAIRKHDVPEFSPATIASTLFDLLDSREKFFAERIDGVFRSLSTEHVTNRPQGFGKRMIIAGMHGWSGSYSRVGLISDLRAVVAKFMGREEPLWNTSSVLVDLALRRHGEWTDVDGGALRLRVYLKGTAHLEVHPEMAWRLNAVLHTLYPRAIAEEFRRRPVKRDKSWKAIERPLPSAVLGIIANGRTRNGLEMRDSARTDRPKVFAEAVRVVEYLGGVVGKYGDVSFPYDATEVLRELLTRGCLPDTVTHQYYPTPPAVADVVMEMAGIEPRDSVLEPSAGQGALADRVAAAGADLTCIELSAIHAAVLRAKGHSVVEEDFLAWAPAQLGRWRKIVMNPPFSEGRWQAHLAAAAGLLTNDGLLVAVLPASAKGKPLLEGFNLEWSEVLVDEFSGASVDVVVVRAVRAQQFAIEEPSREESQL